MLANHGWLQVAHLVTALFQKHDLLSIDVICFALTPSDGSEIRQQVASFPAHFQSNFPSLTYAQFLDFSHSFQPVSHVSHRTACDRRSLLRATVKRCDGDNLSEFRQLDGSNTFAFGNSDVSNGSRQVESSSLRFVDLTSHLALSIVEAAREINRFQPHVLGEPSKMRRLLCCCTGCLQVMCCIGIEYVHVGYCV